MAEDELVRGILRRRMSVQRLLDPPVGTATEVVRLLTCVQSQEYAHAFWSLGMRSADLTCAEVRREFDQGGFVRTHILRPTWHFVAVEDLRWILSVTSPRVQQLNRSRYRQLDLDQHVLDRGSELIVAALAGGRALIRRELGVALREGGIAIDGQRLAYLVMNAELEALICSGEMRGAQHTYVLVEARAAPTATLGREEALGELAWRFFTGHGPASVKDFTRWSSLSTVDALAGVQRAADRLEVLTVDDQTLWAAPSWSPAPAGPETALLLPLYDEVSLSYPQLNFPVAAEHPHPPGTDRFVGTVVYHGVNYGTWRRTVRGGKVMIETALAPGMGGPGRIAVAAAVDRLAAFLGCELETPPTPNRTG